MKKLLRLALFTSALVTALAFTGCDPNVDEPAKKQEDSERGSKEFTTLVNDDLVFTYNIYVENQDFYETRIDFILPKDENLKKDDIVKVKIKGVSNKDIENLYVYIFDNTKEAGTFLKLTDDVIVYNIKANEPFEQEVSLTIKTAPLGKGKDSHRILLTYEGTSSAIIFKDAESVKPRSEIAYKLNPDGVYIPLEEGFKIEQNKWYIVKGTIQVDEPSYGEITHIDIMETKTYEPFVEWGLINSWSGRPVSGDDYSFRKIWHVTDKAQTGKHGELYFAPHWRDGDTDVKTKTATANMKVKKIEVVEIELEEELPYYFTVDNDEVNDEGGGKILELDSPITLEAGKTYKVSGTLKIGKPEKGIITRVFLQDRKVYGCFGNWNILQDYETGLGNKEHHFSAQWTVSADQAGVHNEVQVNMRWSKGVNNESVMGSYCFFDLPEFKIEEVIED